MPSTTRYQSSYQLTFPWVAPDPKCDTNAFCTLCTKVINLTRMGKSAITSHAGGQHHRDKVASLQNCVPLETFVHSSVKDIAKKDANVASIEGTPSTSGTNSNSNELQLAPYQGIKSPTRLERTGKQAAMAKYLLTEEKTKAEILMCLLLIDAHISIRATGKCVKMFPLMFHDSEIATSVQLQKSKICYSLVFGIGQHFQRKVFNIVSASDVFVAQFDESMNTVTRRTQMDIHIKFWNKSTSLVTSRYFDSAFLERTKAANLMLGLKNSFGDQFRKCLQLSMDGPNVNLKVLKDLNKELEDSDDKRQLLNIGSCGLHVVHGAMKTGFKKTDWNIDKFLKAAHYLFYNSSAQKSVFTNCTGSDVFPLPFCGTRWVENARVAERALDVVDDLRTYVEKLRTTESDDKPKSKNFDTVAEHVDDKLLAPKLAFFVSVARTLEPFLTEFQSDLPLAPFLHTELFELMQKFMKRVVKPDVLKNAKSMIRIDMKDSKNLVSTKNFEMDFATRHALKQWRNIPEKDVVCLHEKMRTCLVALIAKLQERSPLKYPLTLAISCLDPAVALSDKDHQRLSKCLGLVVSNGWMSGMKADRAKEEFIHLYNQAEFQEKLKTFDRKEDRLDKFLMDAVKLSSRGCENFVQFVQRILIMSHGNATVERGFSVNSECVVENQTERSLVAQRHIYDAIQDAGGIEEVKIDKSLIHSMRNAHSLYKSDLDEKKKEADKENQEQQSKKRKQAEIKQLEAKRAKMLAEAAHLSSEIEQLQA